MADFSWNDVWADILARRELSVARVQAIFEKMMDGRCDDAEAAAFLIGMRTKGETAGEIAAAAEVLRRHMLRWDPGCEVLDTCGTGGDGSGTFNVSTAVALVAAGAGLKVVKHGNRSVSSRSGSADVLAELGVAIEGDAKLARRQLERAGLAFCFAPRYHPALRHVAALRRRLGVPTIFNFLGPLVNPAGAERQLVGVSRPELLELMAEALKRLGTKRAIVVCGDDGLDEVSLAATTNVRDVSGGTIRSYKWTAQDFRLAPVQSSEVRAADAKESAFIILQVLAGSDGSATRMVLASAAAAFIAAGKARTPDEGVALGRESLASGRARQVLEELRAIA